MPSQWSQEAYIDAARFAAAAHREQTVPGTDLPYLLHVSCVAMELIAALAVEAGHDGDVAVQCALLHDVLEDTPCTRAELEARFGGAVSAGVSALTKNAALGKAERMPDSLARIRQQPAAVWMVKLADRVTNMHAPPAAWPLDKRRAYQDEAWTVLRSLGEASPLLAARLQQLITDYDAYLV